MYDSPDEQEDQAAHRLVLLMLEGSKDGVKEGGVQEISLSIMEYILGIL